MNPTENIALQCITRFQLIDCCLRSSQPYFRYIHEEKKL